MTKEDMTAAIISIGTELMRGEIQDTHLQFLSRELRRLNITVTRALVLPDSREAVKTGILSVVRECAFVFITGGLGPTSDDITREAVSDASGKALAFNRQIWQEMGVRFPAVRLAESNRRQALIPEGFAPIDNPLGTACGFRGKMGTSTIIVLPGPPRELQGMFLGSIVPLLEKDASLVSSESLEGCIYLAGESRIEDEFEKAGEKGVTLHTRLAVDRVLVRVEGGEISSRERVFRQFESAFGRLLVRRGDLSSGQALFNMLTRSGSKIVFAESCTGGLLSEWLTDIPGSSKVFWGGYVVYSNESKSMLLGVSPDLIERDGAVSETVAKEMAKNALERSGADYSVAVTGIAGPEGGTPEKPVGSVWVAVSGGNKNGIVMFFSFSGARDRVRRKTATSAFLMAEAFILGNQALDIKGGKW